MIGWPLLGIRTHFSLTWVDLAVYLLIGCTYQPVTVLQIFWHEPVVSLGLV